MENRPKHQKPSYQLPTLVDDEGTVWVRLNCRGCVLKDNAHERFPVWVPKGVGSGLCQKCREPHEQKPGGFQGFNVNLHRHEIHTEQYDGSLRWFDWPEG